MCGKLHLNGVLTAFMAILISACGASESSSGGNSQNFQAVTIGHSMFFRELSPLFLAFERNCPGLPNPNLCNILAPVHRELGLNQYDAVIQPDLTPDGIYATTFVTGIGLEAADHITHMPMTIHLGVMARQFDFSSGMFTNNTRIFSAPGESFDGAQDFRIMNAVPANIFLTGLGLRLFGGNITRLELQRKPLAELGRDGDDLGASNHVILENGWVATGFLIRVSPLHTTDPIPFLQDVLMYTSQLNIQ